MLHSYIKSLKEFLAHRKCIIYFLRREGKKNELSRARFWLQIPFIQSIDLSYYAILPPHCLHFL